MLAIAQCAVTILVLAQATHVPPADRSVAALVTPHQPTQHRLAPTPAYQEVYCLVPAARSTAQAQPVFLAITAIVGCSRGRNVR